MLVSLILFNRIDKIDRRDCKGSLFYAFVDCNEHIVRLCVISSENVENRFDFADFYNTLPMTVGGSSIAGVPVLFSLQGDSSMKKLFVIASRFTVCFAVVLVLSKVSFAQSEEAVGRAHTQPQLSVENIVADAGIETEAPAVPHALPFGYPPYPMTPSGHPTYGVPYSYPQAPQTARPQRRIFARFAPPQAVQPHPLPAPGAVPGAVTPPTPPMAAPPLTIGQVPQQQGTVAVGQTNAVPGQSTVVYRPTPIKNFRALMFSPRPYIGYDPYAGYPPFPGYQPPQ